MNLRIKLFLLLIILAIFIISGILFYMRLDKEVFISLLSSEKKDTIQNFDKILELKGKPLETLALDYTYWDDMVSFVSTGDRTWAEQNLDTTFSTYDCNSLWVFNSNFSLVYSNNNLEIEALKEFPLPKEALKKAFSQTKLPHFFTYTSTGLLELRGATIHPSADSERQTPARGYFLVGRVWDKQYIDELSRITHTTIKLVPVAEKFERKTRDIPEEGRVSFYKTFFGWDFVPIAYLDIFDQSEAIRVFNRMSKRIFMALVVSAIIIILTLLFFLMRLAYVPLTLISATLAKSDPKYIKDLIRHRDEIGEVSRLIIKFFEQEERIRKAQAVMQEAIDMRSQFISLASHELRTPLTALKESIDIVSEESANLFNAEQKDFLDIARRNLQRLARLINDLLDFQKLEAGKVEFKMLENDINEVINEVRKTMVSLTEKKGLAFSLALDQSLPKIKFDKDKITQVLTNLVNNAIKFTEIGSITVASARKDNALVVSVTDTGPGIRQEDLSRLFVKFQQLGTLHERKTGGTGLGLAICKEIIEKHNGKVWAESEIGKGTTFSFLLPIQERRQDRGA